MKMNPVQIKIQNEEPDSYLGTTTENQINR